jgi:hypothetical protein
MGELVPTKPEVQWRVTVKEGHSRLETGMDPDGWFWGRAHQTTWDRDEAGRIVNVRTETTPKQYTVRLIQDEAPMHWFRPGRQQVLFFLFVAMGVAIAIMAVMD